MDLRHLRYFLAVAEEQNFTRAAARLHISQPPLSQQIQQLERELDVALLQRTSSGAVLTSAGQCFAEHAKQILLMVEKATLATRRTAQGELGSLRIGFTRSAAYHPIVAGSVREFRATYPDVRVELFEAFTAAQLQGLAEGQIDAAFIRPASGEASDFATIHLFDEPMLVVLPHTHRLARAHKVEIAELAEDDFILYPRSNGRHLYDAIVAACREAGFSPRVGQEAPQLASTVTLIAAGTGVAIVPESMNQLNPPGVVYKQIAGKVPHAPMAIVHRGILGQSPTSNFLNLVLSRVGAM